MSEEKWAEREFSRLSQETKGLHSRIDKMGEKVATLDKNLSGDIREIGVKLDTLIKTNGKGGNITRGQLILIAAVISGLFGLIQAMIAGWG